jgi:glycosyltransferase involved in cell wall biosynthesis
MKILYVHQYFKTPEQGGATRSFRLAQTLVNQGHTVEMITTHPGKTYTIQQVAQIRVHYLPVAYAQAFGTWQRITAFLRFVWLSIRLLHRLRDADLCYATSTPLTVGLVALWGKWRYGIPYFFEVRDAWPEVPVALGIIRNTWLKAMLYAMQRLIYRHSEKIIVLAPENQRSIQAQYPHKPVVWLPNMAEVDFWQTPVTAQPPPGLPMGKFVVAYMGAMGYANALDGLLDLAAYAQQQGDEKLYFLLVGEGSHQPALAARAQALGLQNLHFLPLVSKSTLRSWMPYIGAVYVSFRQEEVLRQTSPNKFFDGLAAGKLCMVNIGGWLSDLVTQHACGLYAPPDQPAATYHQLQAYAANPQALAQAQQNALHLAQTHFEATVLCNRWVALFA